MTEYREFLTELGYDTYRKGGTFFLDLMDEVVSMLQDGKSNDEVRVLIPCIFIEHYHFYYEISRFKYLEELSDFCKNGYVLKNKLEKKKRNETIEDKLLRLSNRYLKQNIIKRNQKVYKLSAM